MRKRRLKNRFRVWFARRANRRLCSFLIRGLVSLLAVFLVAYGVVHLPLITIQAVRVTPESDITEILQKEILIYVNNVLGEYKYGIPGDVRYFLGKHTIENMIQKKFLYIETARIDKEFFNEWHLTVKRRKVFGTTCNEEQCLLIDMNGLIFGTTDTMKMGHSVSIADDVSVGEYLFAENESDDTEKNGVEDFRKIEKIAAFLEKDALYVRRITVQKGNRDVYIELENSIGIWINTTESLWDITRALHIAFSEKVIGEDGIGANLSSIVICDPFRVYWTPDVPWKKGCRVLNE